MPIVQQVLAYASKLWSKGLFHMFGARVINQIIIFCSGMILVRILTKEDYGIYSYIQNTIAFFLLLDGLGATTGLLQYGSKYYGEGKMSAFFRLSMRQGLFANLVIAILIVCYALIFVHDSDMQQLFIIAAFLPMFNIVFSIFQIYNIVRRENRFYSAYTSINTILLMVALLGGAYFWNLKGIFILKYVSCAITIVIGMIYLYRHRNKFPKISAKIERKEIAEYRKFSIVALGSNAISQIVLILDVFLIGLILNDMSVLASFKTATLIPFGLLFIPGTIMTFVYPYFVENADNRVWILNNYNRLVKVLAIIFAIIAMGLILTSSWLIPFVFGEQYQDAVLPFNILCIGFFFAAAFRSPAGNTLAALGKVDINLYIACATGVLNIVMDIFLIKTWGSIGAAITSTTVFITTALAGNILLYRTLKKRQN